MDGSFHVVMIKIPVIKWEISMTNPSGKSGQAKNTRSSEKKSYIRGRKSIFAKTVRKGWELVSFSELLGNWFYLRFTIEMS
jgi:hypothetical protein